jgi:biopolymer transport protein ExbD
MSFGSFRQGSTQAQPMAEINTTPLVDVMLVLLVIFIITAPLFHQAVPVDLPRVESTRLEDKPLVVQCAIDAAGTVHLNGKAMADAQIDAQFRSLFVKGGPAPELHLRADRKTPYERVAMTMALAQRAGITKIAFVTLSGGVPTAQ